MRRLFLTLAVFAALTTSAAAREQCAEAPELPELPGPRIANDIDAREAANADRAYARDIEVYLICLQLMSADIRADAAQGRISAAAARAAQARVDAMAAVARGLKSNWDEDYREWKERWEKAHGKPAPGPDPER